MHLAVAIEQAEVRRAKPRALRENAGARAARRHQDQPEPEKTPQTRAEAMPMKHQRARPHNGNTMNGRFGSSPNISVRYSASTRVAGSRKAGRHDFQSALCTDV